MERKKGGRRKTKGGRKVEDASKTSVYITIFPAERGLLVI
jgi:hypothetical protein